MNHKPARLVSVFFSLLLATICLSGISGCSSGSDTTVITPTENFQEPADVAAEKAKAMAESQNQPL
jgi:hypothetical protein